MVSKSSRSLHVPCGMRQKILAAFPVRDAAHSCYVVSRASTNLRLLQNPRGLAFPNCPLSFFQKLARMSAMVLLAFLDFFQECLDKQGLLRFLLLMPYFPLLWNSFFYLVEIIFLKDPMPLLLTFKLSDLSVEQTVDTIYVCEQLRNNLNLYTFHWPM